MVGPNGGRYALGRVAFREGASLHTSDRSQSGGDGATPISTTCDTITKDSGDVMTPPRGSQGFMSLWH